MPSGAAQRPHSKTLSPDFAIDQHEKMNSGRDSQGMAASTRGMKWRQQQLFLR
jgi:hypothetical protein